MSVYKARLQLLEEKQCQRVPASHFVSIVHTPWHLGEAAEARWLSEEVTCACGQRGCPDLSIGAILPAKAPSAEAWAERARRYRAGTL